MHTPFFKTSYAYDACGGGSEEVWAAWEEGVAGAGGGVGGGCGWRSRHNDFRLGAVPYVRHVPSQFDVAAWLACCLDHGLWTRSGCGMW